MSVGSLTALAEGTLGLAVADAGRTLSLAMTTCPSCSGVNPEGARFCNSCGAPLAAGGPTEARKTVTVLFCDLVGSTSLGDGTDPEALRSVMGRFHAELRTILERHGGTVEKFIGDAAMAVFGIPRAHEDDALRAVRAADEIRGAVPHLGLEARTGVNTGEVMVGEGETLVTGDAVNVAARLEQAASSGEVLLGERTYALVRDAVRVEPLAPLEVKGKSKPVRAYRLQEVRDAAASTGPVDAPFVGRAAELELLARTLARATDGRVPHLATVVAPPGIGKSRLTLEFARNSHARTLVGRCLSYGEGITYRPLAEIVDQVGDVRAVLTGQEDGELAASRIDATLRTTGSTASPEEAAWGFRRLFETLSGSDPLIVVLDDIHWAEPTLLDLIEYVSTFARDARLLVVCSARPDLLEQRPTWATPTDTSVLVSLKPLGLEETATLVDDLRTLPDATRARIVEAAEGNPLFVEQMVAAQSEEGGREATIPPSIQALLAARIDRLDAEERAVLENAAIEGRVFHRGSIQRLLPEDARMRVGSHLLTLVRKDFILPDRTLIPGDDAFRFGHNLIREAAYEALPKRRRAELHERFADAYVSRLGDDAIDETVGFHLEQAYRYRVEIGPDDDAARHLAQRAGRALAAAGRRAHASGDDGEARRSLGRAVELLGGEDPEGPVAIALLGSSMYEAGDTLEALELARRAQAAAAATGQRGVELRARMDELAIGVRNDPTLDPTTALAEAQTAIAELERLGDAEAQARAWRAVIEIGFMIGDMQLVGDASEGLLACAQRTGIRRDEVWAVRGFVAALTYGPHPVADAIVRAEEALARFPHERAGEDHLALLYAFGGRFDEAFEAMDRSRRVREELGQILDHAVLSYDLTLICFLAGQPERAEPALVAAVEVLERGGERDALSGVMGLLGETCHRLGRDDEALEWSRRSERTAVGAEENYWRATRAKVLAMRGEADEALRLSGEDLDNNRGSESLPFLAMALSDRAEVLLLLGRREEARETLEEALAVYERKGIGPAIQRTRAHLAELG